MYIIEYVRPKGGIFKRKFKTMDEIVKFEAEHPKLYCYTHKSKIFNPEQLHIYKQKEVAYRIKNLTISWTLSYDPYPYLKTYTNPLTTINPTIYTTTISPSATTSAKLKLSPLKELLSKEIDDNLEDTKISIDSGCSNDILDYISGSLKIPQEYIYNPDIGEVTVTTTGTLTSCD